MELLHGRIQSLKDIFLPTNWDPIGDYSQHVREQAAAFTLMVHAEIESYIEIRVSRYAEAREKAWILRREVHKSLLAFVQVAFTDANKQATKGDISLDELVRLGRRMLTSRIAGNHGIKEQNLLRLLPAIGIKLRELPPGLAPDLTSLGATRGEYAHTSGHSRTLVNPQDEYSAVARIILALGEFDQLTDTTAA